MEEIKRGRGAPVGSANRKLPPGEAAEAHLHLRCRAEEKAAWVKAAQGKGGLSAWVVETLNEAATNQSQP